MNSAITNNFLLSLKEATAEKHRDIEKVSLLKKVFSEEVTYLDYIEVIKRFHSVYTLVEPIVYSNKELQTWLKDLESRKKLHLLEKDLEDTKQNPLASLNSWPLNSIDELWGCLYVLEGSTLGGQVISRHLEKTLGIHSHFYIAYADKTGEMWKNFCKAICSYEENIGNREIIIKSAIATFQVLERSFNE